jgi:hypothetical protein
MSIIDKIENFLNEEKIVTQKLREESTKNVLNLLMKAKWKVISIDDTSFKVVLPNNNWIELGIMIDGKWDILPNKGNPKTVSNDFFKIQRAVEEFERKLR